MRNPHCHAEQRRRLPQQVPFQNVRTAVLVLVLQLQLHLAMMSLDLTFSTPLLVETPWSEAGSLSGYPRNMLNLPEARHIQSSFSLVQNGEGIPIRDPTGLEFDDKVT